MEHDENREKRSQKIARESPEGTPAHPRLTSGGLMGIILITLLPPVAIAIAVYYLFGPNLAMMALVVGLVVCFLANPAVWATFFRARERHEIDDRQ
ncbi:MAG: hypothetical protein WD114_06070 [Phycisphaerales bacterium]